MESSLVPVPPSLSHGRAFSQAPLQVTSVLTAYPHHPYVYTRPASGVSGKGTAFLFHTDIAVCIQLSFLRCGLYLDMSPRNVWMCMRALALPHCLIIYILFMTLFHYYDDTISAYTLHHICLSCFVVKLIHSFVMIVAYGKMFLLTNWLSSVFTHKIIRKYEKMAQFVYFYQLLFPFVNVPKWQVQQFSCHFIKWGTFFQSTKFTSFTIIYVMAIHSCVITWFYMCYPTVYLICTWSIKMYSTSFADPTVVASEYFTKCSRIVEDTANSIWQHGKDMLIQLENCWIFLYKEKWVVCFDYSEDRA